MFYKLYENLNRLLGLSFKDTELENKFQILYIKNNLDQNVIAVKIAFVAYLSYYVVAYFSTPEDFFFNAIFILPIPLIFSLLFLYYVRSYAITTSHLFKLFLFAIAIGFPPVINIAVTELYTLMYVTNLMLPIFAVFVMYGVPFSLAFMSISSLLVYFFIILNLANLDTGQMIYSTFLIITTFIISAASGYLLEKSQRKNYLAVFTQEDLNTKLKEEQEKNVKKEKLLQQQARLAQMGEMISMIAHQWRQPLGAISSSLLSIQTKELSGKFDLSQDQERELFLNFMHKKHQNINEYVQILSTTIDDFRNFFKADREKKLTAITIPIERALHIVEESIKSHNIDVTTNFKDNGSLYIYQNELMQVILNILKNAEDNFLEKKIQNPQLYISSDKDDSNFIITIQDNGGGIDKEILPHIFDPYFSTKDEKNGTGLGLYMSKIMIEKHNEGKLSAQNLADGVSFKILLKAER